MNQCESCVRAIKKMVVGSEGAVIPEEYQQVEYLQSSGTQYIRTGIYAANGLQITYQTVTFDNDGGIAAERSGHTNNNKFGMTYNTYKTNNAVIMAHGANYDLLEDYGKHTVKHGANVDWTANVDGTDVRTFPISARSVPNVEFLLFKDPGTHKSSKCKIYQVKLYKDGGLKRDFYPCYRKSDNKPGMYDLVSRTFFTNNGSGEFTVGDNV